MNLVEGKILYVDDDDDDRFMLCTAIHDIDPSIQVVERENGVEAVVYLKEAKMNDELPCLILLDINMPFLDGKQTLDKIRSDLGLDKVPVVMYTSSLNPNDRELFKSKGVEMVSKPMDNNQLQAIVKDFLYYCPR